MEKLTLIYIDSWSSGSHMHSLTRFLRVQKSSTESMEDMLKRTVGDPNKVVYIFEGHSKLVGET